MVVRFSQWKDEDNKMIECNATDFVPGYKKPLRDIRELIEEPASPVKKKTDWNAVRAWIKRNEEYRKSKQ
jgi:hypothetical protein